MRELYMAQDRMQSRYSVFELGDKFSGLACRDIKIGQFSPIIRVHKSATENNSTRG